MLLDSDKDVLENSYGEWFERMYESFKKQIQDQLTMYNTIRCEMITDEVLRLHLPFVASVRYIRKIEIEEFSEQYQGKGEVIEVISVVMLRPDEIYVKIAVKQAMDYLVGSADFNWKTIEPSFTNCERTKCFMTSSYVKLKNKNANKSKALRPCY